MLDRGFLRATPHPTPPHPRLIHDVLYLLPSGSSLHHIASEKLSGEGQYLARLPGPLCAPPLEGRSIGPGGGEPPPPVFPQIKYFCSLEGAYCEALGHGDVRQGGGV